MIRQAVKYGTLAVFVLALLVIAGLIVYPRLGIGKRPEQNVESRVVLPQNLAAGEVRTQDNSAERLAYEDTTSPKIALREGESLISVLNQNFDGDPREKQIVAYYKPAEIESPVYIAYVDYDDSLGAYKRAWEIPTAITRPSTLNLYSRDIIGDRTSCVVIMGMNGNGEHILIIFQKKPRTSVRPAQTQNFPEDPFVKIVEIRVEGSVSVRESERSNAYHLGMANGVPFTIAAYSRDYESANIMDQIETVYAYNAVNGLYEQQRVVRIPGTQIEQRRVRELLGGSAEKFEEFIDGLWYYVSPEGTLNRRQFVYFDTDNREIIFYEDQTQQVFSWRSSSPTRYGLYLSAQNVSVVTLRRFIDIELESLESIKIKASEDVRLKIGVSDPWNGSYRRSGPAQVQSGDGEKKPAHLDSVYTGSIGKLRFKKDGSYTLENNETTHEGKYAFFALGSQELLELRPESVAGLFREVYRVEREEKSGGDFTLIRVRLGTKGIQELHETAIPMAHAAAETSGS